MPKRVIDFDAMWGSDKLAACAEWAQAEYAWLYGLADASGCFELTNLRVIWGRVAAIRRNLSIERLEQIFGEFQEKGLLFAWEHEGKRYGHWTGSDVPGRLPPPSWRMRLERLAPPVPKQALAEYVSRYARGRAGLAGGVFLAEGRQEQGNFRFEISDLKAGTRDETGSEARRTDSEHPGGRQGNSRFEISDLKDDSRRGAEDRLTEIKGGVESGQGQNWNRDLNWKEKGDREGGAAASSGAHLETERRQSWSEQAASFGSAARCGSASNLNSDSRSNSKSSSLPDSPTVSGSNCDFQSNRQSGFDLRSNGEARLNAGKTSGNAHAADGVKGESVRANDSSGEGPDATGVAGERSGTNRSDAQGGGGEDRAYREGRAVAARASYGFRARDKAEIVAAELLVGRGPVCGPMGIKPEALERIRRRNAARDGSRSP